MKKLAVFGNPVLHSLSPIIFNEIAKRYDVDSHYSRLIGENLNEIIKLAKALKINAVNVTSPFKSDTYKIADQRKINCNYAKTANFLNFKDNLKIADNTDYIAFSNIISNNCPDLNSKILILGGGDTAKLCLNILINQKYSNICLAVRNIIKVKNEIKNIAGSVTVLNINEIADLNEYDVMINTIPETILNFNELDYSSNLLIIDTIYQNTFLNNFNCKYISGQEWLIRQAIPIINELYNINPEYSEINDILINNKKKQNIVISGFMASGKTTVTQLTSNVTGLKFIDSDIEIEKKMNLKIYDIFQKYGEEYFRKIESEVINEIMMDSNQIISIGGGSLNSKELAEVIYTNAYIIYLYVPYYKIIERLKHQENIRPLSNNPNLEEIFNNREEKYFKYSDLIIDNCNELETTIRILENEINLSFKN